LNLPRDHGEGAVALTVPLDAVGMDEGRVGEMAPSHKSSAALHKSIPHEHPTLNPTACFQWLAWTSRAASGLVASHRNGFRYAPAARAARWPNYLFAAHGLRPLLPAPTQAWQWDGVAGLKAAAPASLRPASVPLCHGRSLLKNRGRRHCAKSFLSPTIFFLLMTPRRRSRAKVGKVCLKATML
jgi:hypothetical protein